MNKRSFSRLMMGIFILVGILVFSLFDAMACTTIIVGKNATEDGSVLMSFCNDGNILSWVTVEKSREYALGTKIPMLSNRPIPGDIAGHEEQVRHGYDVVGYLNVPEDIPEKTYQFISGRSRYMARQIIGFNEFGVTTGAEYTPMMADVKCYKGVFGGATNHWTTSLCPLVLMQAKTAREAVQVMGRLIEKYGFQFYYSTENSIAIPVADRNEGWLMEMFPPGPDWTPGCGKPGAVWVAQRVPDDSYLIYANRSRIGKIDLDDAENFMGSSNIYSLAEELGLWDPDEEFIWWKVYSLPGGTWNVLREWFVYHTLSPSLGFETSGDAFKDRYPTFVKPDKPIKFQDIANIMRTQFEGTEWDVMEDPVWLIDGEKSPLARAQGDRELFNLLSAITGRKINKERAIVSDSTTQWYIVHNRSWLPDPIATAAWYSLGPTYTSMLAPIYPAVTQLPPSWTEPSDFNVINRDQVAWNMRLVHNIAHIKEEPAMRDIKGVLEPAEEKLFAMREKFEEKVIEVYDEKGEEAAIEMLTDYTYFWFNQIHHAYDELVDYLLYHYVYQYPNKGIPARLPVVVPPDF